MIWLSFLRYQLLLLQWLYWFSFWNRSVSLMIRTYILKIRIMSLLMSFRSWLFLWSWFWWSSYMFWMDILLSVFFIWRNWRKRCSRGLVITGISWSYCAMLLLFWLIFVCYGLSLFLLIFMFDNNFDLLFWRHTKYFPFNLFSWAWLFLIIDWLSLVTQITIVLNLL